MKPLINPVEEFLLDVEQDNKGRASKLIFEATPEDVDIKTDINHQEIVLLNKLDWNNQILKKYGLNPVFEKFINGYMRKKISLDRKSRGEFVKINQENKTDDLLDGMKLGTGLSGKK